MADLPQVSVVIPTYNRAEMLRATLESVLAQTVPVREIVVVDDGSTDHTPKVVGDLAEAGAPVVYLREPHENKRGPARNRGAEATSAPLVAFLDSDDLWKPHRLERQLEALEKSPHAGFAFCNVHRFDEGGLINSLPCLHPSADYNGRILGDMLEEPLAVSSTLLVRREVFDRAGGFADLRMNEDYEFSLRLAAACEASYVPEVLVLMREHGGRTSRSDRELPLLDYVRIVEGFLDRYPDLPPEVRARGRRGLANVHLKLARLYLEYGDRAATRRHVRSLFRLRPWDRRGMAAYLRSWSPAASPSTPGA
jgi:glycosyltransferase involved in cell wall biosynthesis